MAENPREEQRTTGESRSDAGLAICCALAVLAVAIRVVPGLPSALWVDETATVWATKGGLAELSARCVTFPLSMIYALMILGIEHLAGTREWLLRLPSLAAVSLAGVFLFRMARRLWGLPAAWLAIATFASLPGVAFAAGDARPYAFGLLFIVLSTGFLVRLLERPDFRGVALYGITAGLAVHYHLLFGAPLLAHCVYVARERVCGRILPAKYILSASAVFCLVVAPLVRQTLLVAKNPKLHSFSPVPDLSLLIGVLVPPMIIVCLLAAFFYVVAFCDQAAWEPSRNSNVALLAGLVAFVPALVLFALSHLSHTGMFLSRYLLSCTGGFALLVGVLAGFIRPATVGKVMAVALLAIQLYVTYRDWPNRHTSGLGNWEAAIEYTDRLAARGQTPVLVRSQYIESDVLPVAPMQDNPVFSQFSAYPTRSRVAGIAASAGPRQAEQFEEFLRLFPGSADHFFLLSTEAPPPALTTYISGRLGPATQMRNVADFDGVALIEFQTKRSLL